MWKFGLLIFLAGLVSACAPGQSAAPAQATPTDAAVFAPPPTRPAAALPAAGTEPPAVPSATLPAGKSAVEQARRLGRGVNLGNALEAPNEGDWGVTLEAADFMIIKDGGFNHVRVPINWVDHADQAAPYTIAPAFFERIDWVVKQALDQNLIVILDFHSFGALMTAPQENQARFSALWDQIARHYQDYSEDVFFELLNEPNGPIASTNAWNSILAETLQVVRQSNPNRMVIIGPGEWNSFSALDYLQLPPDDPQIIVTFHYYQPFNFTHQGAEWNPDSAAWLGTTWTGTEAQQRAVQADFDQVLQWSKRARRPIYLGEFGAYHKADMDSRHAWTSAIARQAEARGFAWAYWEYCAGFGVYDKTQRAWVDPIYSALMP